MSFRLEKKTLLKITIVIAIMGLGMIFSVILSNSAYPDMFFRVVTPLGLFLVFVSVFLLIVSWLWCLKDALKAKQYMWSMMLLAMGLIVAIRELVRIIQ